MASILAIDYGRKRCGLAITDILQIIASPLETTETKELLSYITKIIKQQPIEKIIVGEPRNLKGGLNDIEADIQAFIYKLSHLYPAIKIIRIDERYTSSLAKKAILHSGVGRQKRQDKTLVDKVSATLILQSYLHNKL